MSLPSSTASTIVAPFIRESLTYQELNDALKDIVPVEDVDHPNTPDTYWLLSHDGQRLNSTLYTEAQVCRLRDALRDSQSASPQPLPVRVEYWVKAEEERGDALMGGVET
ncbi:hypothetical protein EDB86DRAFT_2838894 [Lactarius hatsudake]|nr:hypothetical protein EDB86DRAFT_2838894 [Lactarius hatsudake]